MKVQRSSQVVQPTVNTVPDPINDANPIPDRNTDVHPHLTNILCWESLPD